MKHHNMIFQTVVETPEFIKQVELLATKEAIHELILFIAKNPLKGDLIEGTGGARKLRWHTGRDKGKSGGMRIIYFCHDHTVPIFLFTAYGKNQRANISANDKKILKTIIKQIIINYQRGQKHESDR